MIRSLSMIFQRLRFQKVFIVVRRQASPNLPLLVVSSHNNIRSAIEDADTVANSFIIYGFRR